MVQPLIMNLTVHIRGFSEIKKPTERETVHDFQNHADPRRVSCFLFSPCHSRKPRSWPRAFCKVHLQRVSRKKYGFCEHVRGPLPLPNTILAVEFGLVESESTRLLASARKLINLSVSMCARDRASIFAQLCCFVVVAFSNINCVVMPTQCQKVMQAFQYRLAWKWFHQH